MGQPLVHPQRLGSLVEASSCTLVKDEQGLVVYFSPLPFVGVLGIGLAHVGWSLWAGLCLSYKMDINNTCCRGFSSLMDFYY